jgi:AcrR family transcriptional regulator
MSNTHIIKLAFADPRSAHESDTESESYGALPAPTARPAQGRTHIGGGDTAARQGRAGGAHDHAVAETAGVSIGTLYQYFPNKEAILEALADREMAALSARVIAVLQDRSVASPQDRIGRILRAVTASYGQRPRVHRLVMEQSLSRGATRAAPLIEQILAMLTAQDRPPNAMSMTEAEAFVLTNAFVGIFRAMMMRPDTSTPAQGEIEEAMGRLITSYLQHRPVPPGNNVNGD